MAQTEENILSTCQEGAAWRAPAGKKGSEAEIVFDLMCKQSVHSIAILNGFGDFGTQSFILWGARTNNGQWRKLKIGKLPSRSNEVNSPRVLIL